MCNFNLNCRPAVIPRCREQYKSVVSTWKLQLQYIQNAITISLGKHDIIIIMLRKPSLSNKYDTKDERVHSLSSSFAAKRLSLSSQRIIWNWHLIFHPVTLSKVCTTPMGCFARFFSAQPIAALELHLISSLHTSEAISKAFCIGIQQQAAAWSRAHEWSLFWAAAACVHSAAVQRAAGRAQRTICRCFAKNYCLTHCKCSLWWISFSMFSISLRQIFSVLLVMFFFCQFVWKVKSELNSSNLKMFSSDFGNFCLNGSIFFMISEDLFQHLPHSLLKNKHQVFSVIFSCALGKKWRICSLNRTSVTYYFFFISSAAGSASCTCLN